MGPISYVNNHNTEINNKIKNDSSKGKIYNGIGGLSMFKVKILVD